VKQADLREMFKKPLQKCLYINRVLSPDTLSSNPSTSSTMKTQKTQKRTLMNVNQQMKKISKWNTPQLVAQQKYRRSNKKLPVRT